MDTRRHGDAESAMSPRLAAIPGLVTSTATRTMSAHAEFDLVVVEATPAGVAMGVRAAREGLRVLLATHGRHVGGMLVNGLGVWDTLIHGRRAPVYDEIRQAIFEHYQQSYGGDSPQFQAAQPEPHGHANGRFEPSVAARVLEQLIAAEPLLTLWRGVTPVAVEKRGARLQAVGFYETSTGARRLAVAPVFADCSYEADLAALAGVACRVGREGRDEFGEPHAGRIFVRPVASPGDPAVAALAQRRRRWNLRAFAGAQEVVGAAGTGTADAVVQAYNYRTILSCDPANRLVSDQPPPRYDRELCRTLEFDSLVEPLPNRKASWNRPQLPGRHLRYPNGAAATRQRIRDEHWDATLGLLYFLQNDPEVPDGVRRRWREYGLARDEFADNQHRPYELYVREARRIVGRKMLTEHDVVSARGHERAPVHPDAIGVTEWYVDIHACGTERVRESYPEGKMMLHLETVPGHIPYGTLLPREFDNLLVPVALSATHVGFSAVRVEPTWMALGEAAGFAAAQAVRSGCCASYVDTDRLQRTLAARGVMLTFFNDVEPAEPGGEPASAAAHYFGTKGFFPGYDARLDEPIGAGEAARWARVAKSGHVPTFALTRRDALCRLWCSRGHEISSTSSSPGGLVTSTAPGRRSG
jgi:hypothetical protein